MKKPTFLFLSMVTLLAVNAQIRKVSNQVVKAQNIKLKSLAINPVIY